MFCLYIFTYSFELAPHPSAHSQAGRPVHPEVEPMHTEALETNDRMHTDPYRGT